MTGMSGVFMHMTSTQMNNPCAENPGSESAYTDISATTMGSDSQSEDTLGGMESTYGSLRVARGHPKMARGHPKMARGHSKSSPALFGALGFNAARDVTTSFATESSPKESEERVITL